MSWLKNMGGATGYIIGAVIVLPLILFIVNRFFTKNNNDAEKFVKPYLENVVEIRLKIPKVKYLSTEEFFESKVITTKLVSKNMGRDASKRSDYSFKDVYDTSTNKTIRIAMFDYRPRFWFDMSDSTVVALINKSDFKNPQYGTKERPLMCFSIKSTNSPHSISSNGSQDSTAVYKFDTSLKQFDYNVYMYLTFVMPSEEFEKRFLKK